MLKKQDIKDDKNQQVPPYLKNQLIQNQNYLLKITKDNLQMKNIENLMQFMPEIRQAFSLFKKCQQSIEENQKIIDETLKIDKLNRNRVSSEKFKEQYQLQEMLKQCIHLQKETDEIIKQEHLKQQQVIEKNELNHRSQQKQIQTSMKNNEIKLQQTINALKFEYLNPFPNKSDSKILLKKNEIKKCGQFQQFKKKISQYQSYLGMISCHTNNIEDEIWKNKTKQNTQIIIENPSNFKEQKKNKFRTQKKVEISERIKQMNHKIQFHQNLIEKVSQQFLQEINTIEQNYLINNVDFESKFFNFLSLAQEISKGIEGLLINYRKQRLIMSLNQFQSTPQSCKKINIVNKQLGQFYKAQKDLQKLQKVWQKIIDQTKQF